MRNKYLPLIAVMTLVVTSGSPFSLPAKSRAVTPRKLQKGISVELPVTSAAVPMPDADKEGALIVAVTADGTVYFGIKPTTLTALPDEVGRALPGRADRKLYIKADARTSYAIAIKVLDAVHSAGVESAVLLTGLPETPAPGKQVPPNGLEVLMKSPVKSGSR
jgi:biopolymer transport protein ExbD